MDKEELEQREYLRKEQISEEIGFDIIKIFFIQLYKEKLKYLINTEEVSIFNRYFLFNILLLLFFVISNYYSFSFLIGLGKDELLFGLMIIILTIILTISLTLLLFSFFNFNIFVKRESNGIFNIESFFYRKITFFGISFCFLTSLVNYAFKLSY